MELHMRISNEKESKKQRDNNYTVKREQENFGEKTFKDYYKDTIMSR